MLSVERDFVSGFAARELMAKPHDQAASHSHAALRYQSMVAEMPSRWSQLDSYPRCRAAFERSNARL